MIIYVAGDFVRIDIEANCDDLWCTKRAVCNLFDIEQLRFENSTEEFEQLFLCQFADDNTSIFKCRFTGLLVDSYEEWRDFKPFLSSPFWSSWGLIGMIRRLPATVLH